MQNTSCLKAPNRYEHKIENQPDNNKLAGRKKQYNAKIINQQAP
jgi:hypothetical protein